MFQRLKTQKKLTGTLVAIALFVPLISNAQERPSKDVAIVRKIHGKKVAQKPKNVQLLEPVLSEKEIEQKAEQAIKLLHSFIAKGDEKTKNELIKALAQEEVREKVIDITKDNYEETYGLLTSYALCTANRKFDPEEFLAFLEKITLVYKEGKEKTLIDCKRDFGWSMLVIRRWMDSFDRVLTNKGRGELKKVLNEQVGENGVKIFSLYFETATNSHAIIEKFGWKDTAHMFSFLEEKGMIKPDGWKKAYEELRIEDEKRNKLIFTIVGSVLGLGILAGVITYIRKKLIERGEKAMAKDEEKMTNKFEETKERFKKILIGFQNRFHEVKTKEEFVALFKEYVATGKKMRAENGKELDEVDIHYMAVHDAIGFAKSKIFGDVYTDRI